MKKIICEFIREGIQMLYGTPLPDMENQVEIPADSQLGDFSLPCFQLAKILKKSPKIIAEELQEQLSEQLTVTPVSKTIDEVRAVNGYLNIFLNRKLYVESVLKQALAEDYGSQTVGMGKTICIDYSSPNIAKNFHVGHLRTTIIGNSLYHIFTKLGFRVVRINHLGDWGTQFGRLITAYKKWSSRELVEEKGIEELLRIYVLFENEARKDPQLTDEARAWFAKMEQGNEEALAIWKWFKEISLVEFDRVYRLLDVEFDSWNGESFYIDKIPALVEELKEKHLLQESEGAYIVSLEEYGMPPCLITKKDGSSIYHSRDLAAAIYRKKTYHFSQCLYVTGMEQKLHFSQLFKTLERMGYEWAKDMHHIPYGLVSMGGEKLSTRKGNIVYAEDILQEAVSRALAAIEEKNPCLTGKENTAEQIGVGAVIFHDLAHQLMRDVHFSWEEVLNFDGMTAPYIQYTYARAKSIIRKAKRNRDLGSPQCLTDDISYEIIKLLDRYPSVIMEAAEKYEPSVIAKYAYQLAVLFNKFYQEHRILSAEGGYKEARLALTDAVQKTIRDAMSLLGIACPDEM